MPKTWQNVNWKRTMTKDELATMRLRLQKSNGLPAVSVPIPEDIPLPLFFKQEVVSPNWRCKKTAAWAGPSICPNLGSSEAQLLQEVASYCSQSPNSAAATGDIYATLSEEVVAWLCDSNLRLIDVLLLHPKEFNIVVAADTFLPFVVYLDRASETPSKQAALQSTGLAKYHMEMHPTEMVQL
eukprot:TRINITY_DN29860_c0_g1_i1.p1 TRINITY_DN29860_c0_g1~~TRINITY_DN29860_c0_g1_i1.p1  ORF type:complete len:183 (-),score=28.73 TRINITY_DN29860_c0_g1_i1:168-716(-)